MRKGESRSGIRVPGGVDEWELTLVYKEGTEEQNHVGKNDTMS